MSEAKQFHYRLEHNLQAYDWLSTGRILPHHAVAAIKESVPGEIMNNAAAQNFFDDIARLEPEVFTDDRRQNKVQRHVLLRVIRGNSSPPVNGSLTVFSN